MDDNTKTILALGGTLAIVGIIGAADVGANFVSLIPGIGPLAETGSESVLEVLQFLVTAVGLFVVKGIND